MKPYKISKKKKSSSSVEEIVGSVDDNLLEEILLRLPIKSLIRFKSVSKHWHYSLISDPGFCIRRNPDPNPTVGLIFQIPKPAYPLRPSSPTDAYVVSLDKTTNPQIRALKFMNPNGPRMVLKSCNGLLLCRSISTARNRHLRYYVCNPTTNQCFELPQTDEVFDTWTNLCRTYLAFDPSKSPHYKVVCVRELKFYTGLKYRYKYQFEVYSSETGCWRKCGEPFTADVFFYRGVYWNGAIHWISFTETGKSLYFNPDDDDQTPKVMPSPPMQENGPYLCLRRNYHFEESCGHLHYIDDFRNRVTTGIIVYEMRRDYSEWFVKYRVDCSCVLDLFSCICSLVRGKRDEDSFLVLRIWTKIIRHNLVRNTCETICKLEGAQFRQCFSAFSGLCPDSPLQYIESLCSV